MNTISSEIAQVARAALDYIDALPPEVVARLPTMPGFDRDWAENALRKELGVAVSGVKPHAIVKVSGGGRFYDFRALKIRAKGDGEYLLYLNAPPAQPVAVPEDYFAALVAAARARADKAMRIFPQPNYVLNKVAEESGEVIKAVIHYTEGREEWANVEGEIIDNLAMLIRLVVEGDQVIGFTPPDACRAAMLDGGQS